MKLGNTSQSKVPVPDFFLNRTLKQIETFEVSDRKRYFREKDLFHMTKDLNYCNNPRNFNRKHENFNKEKYIPNLSKINSILEKPESNENNKNKKKFFKSIISSPKSNIYENFLEFFEKTNVTKFTNPDLRGEIRGNINVLINKINDKYDLDKWASTDTRINFMQTNSESYFGCNQENNFNNTNGDNGANDNDDFVFRNFDENFLTKTKRDKRKFNETDAHKFKTILRDKVNAMSIDNELKTKLVKNFDKFGESTSDKFYNPKASNIIENFESEKTPKNLNSIEKINKNKENSSKEIIKKIINNSQSKAGKVKLSNSLNFNYNLNNIHNNNNLYNTKHTNFTTKNKRFNETSSIRYNSNNQNNDLIDINDNFVGKITLPMLTAKHSTINSNFYANQNEVQKLRKDNEKIYDRFKNTTLFRDFPSPDRKEFVLKKGEKLKANKSKEDRVDQGLANFSNYNSSKHKSVFCEDYDTNESVLVKFKKSKQVF